MKGRFRFVQLTEDVPCTFKELLTLACQVEATGVPLNQPHLDAVLKRSQVATRGRIGQAQRLRGLAETSPLCNMDEK